MAIKKIFIAPLDWGLGHATRCIPLINELLKNNAEVILGGSGISGRVLQKEFPQLPYHEIPGYEVTYSSNSSMAVSMLRQAPGILKSIQKEKNWLDDFLKNQPVDIVISDHRYGLHHPEVHCIFIAHQLFISSGNNELLEPVLWKVNRSYIEKFDECWIPDIPGENNASGKLSHKMEIPFKHRFIGLLSRLQPITNVEKKYTATCILSGLEPLRTEFENLIIQQIEELHQGSYLLIRGTEKKLQITPPPHLEVIDMANAETLQNLLPASEIVISRSGYSSIMDYLNTQTKAFLIPTPGQTEQEYLAKYHLEAGNFYSVKQKDLDLHSQLSLAHTYVPQFTNDPTLLSSAIELIVHPQN